MNRFLSILAVLAIVGLGVAAVAVGAGSPRDPVPPAMRPLPGGPLPVAAAPAPIAAKSAAPAKPATPAKPAATPTAPAATPTASAAAPEAPKPDADGFTPLFNGKDLAGWRVDDDVKAHWTVEDGVLKTDGQSGKSLVTEKAYGDFILKIDWRMKDKVSGAVYVRGTTQSQVSMGSLESGSGELTVYRRNRSSPQELRSACTPKRNADNPIGQWNTFVITCKGDTIAVTLNHVAVIPAVHLPGLPASGAIGLLDFKNPLEFKNISIRPLDTTDAKAGQ